MTKDEESVITIASEDKYYGVDSFLVPLHYADYLEGIMIPGGILKDRTEKLAAEILSSYPPGEPLTVICILKSAFRFFTALTSALQNINAGRDKVQPEERTVDSDEWTAFGNHVRSHQFFYEFVRVTSYMDDHSTGRVRVSGISDIESTVTGHNVLIVEDMIDVSCIKTSLLINTLTSVFQTGITMQKILEEFGALKPKTLKVATLLLKRCPTATGYIPDFLGFSVPDRFVVGFGIDYNDYFRDIDHLCVVNDAGKARFAKRTLSQARQS